MLEVLGQAALRTLLLAAAVQLGLGLLHVGRPQLRLAAWTVVLAASLAMPALQWATPFHLFVLPGLPGGGALTHAADLQQQAFAPPAPTPGFVEDVVAPTTALPWLEALYLLVGGVLLLRLAVGVALSLRLAGRAAPVHADWAAGTRVRISRDIAAPVTVGSVVLLPPDAVTWPAALREAVLAHERAHVARRDFAMLLASQINRAVFWFSPLSWWLHGRLATLAELASDDQALAATGDRPGYAEVLLKMGGRPGRLLGGVAMARPATLRYRIERVLTDRGATTSVSLVQQLILVVGAASLSIMAASSRPKTASPPGLAPSLAPVSSAEQKRLPTFADLEPPPAAAKQGRAELVLPRDSPGTAPGAALPTTPIAGTAEPSNSSLVRGARQPALRPTTRSTPPPLPPRVLAQRVRSERDPDAQRVSLLAGVAVPVGPAPRGNDGRGTTSSPGSTAGAGGQTPSSRQTDQLPAGVTPLPRRGDEPSCTGVYLPKQGGSTTDGSVDVVRAVYFQEADGTPWLKLLLGARNRARLNGLDVERTSYRTTVVTTLPRGTTHVTGTTHGTYGSIDYECLRPLSRS